MRAITAPVSLLFETEGRWTNNGFVPILKKLDLSFMPAVEAYGVAIKLLSTCRVIYLLMDDPSFPPFSGNRERRFQLRH